MELQEQVIEVKHLVKKFKDFTAVNDIELNVYRGDIFGFLGPNGAGKSTTIRMLLSLIRPTSGSIKLFGKPLAENRKEILSKIGAIVEKPDFYGYLSAYKNLEILGKVSGCNPTKKMIMEILDLVGLAQRYNSKVKTFSHGMKQRLGIAQALLHNPELIILDEPTTGLDPQGMKEIRDLVVMLAKDKQKTIFLSSHILYEVELVANRLIIINKGSTVIEGSVENLLNEANLDVAFEVGQIQKAEEIVRQLGLSESLLSVTSDRVLLSLRKEQISGVTKALVQNDVELLSVVPKRSLEEYFLKLTDREGK